ncbi:UNVERIFIED_ORG: hypothetical protein J2X79_001115 [Arthrobacter globiformis]|nr:hypothetical protein [Arthrobacter globiformis]
MSASEESPGSLAGNPPSAAEKRFVEMLWNQPVRGRESHSRHILSADVRLFRKLGNRS